MKVFIGEYPKNETEKQQIDIQIDSWDTWNMDTTLAHIVVPMLKQLKVNKHGVPLVDLEDVPEELRVDSKVSLNDVDENYVKRWDYVLDEMIFAFESKLTFWEDQFYLNDECDYEGMRSFEERIKKGFLLFGKYFQALWD